MDQCNHRLVSGNLPLDRLVGNALGEFEQLGYSRRSLDRYRTIWEHFIEFSRQKKLGDEFCGDLAARFVEEYRMGDEEVDKPARSPLRHLIMPEVFHLLYGCGFRLGEVLNLHVRDADLDQGIVTVRQGKFRKDRLVPLALSLVRRLRKYAASFENRPLDRIFFPAPNGAPFSLRTVYGLFRKLLLECGMAHAGRGKGPRIHDLRHTFAVHTLLRWYRDGEDLDAKLPLLATYLGHQHLSGTQRYLHLTAELFPEITARLDAVFGEVIPRRIEP